MTKTSIKEIRSLGNFSVQIWIPEFLQNLKIHCFVGWGYPEGFCVKNDCAELVKVNRFIGKKRYGDLSGSSSF